MNAIRPVPYLSILITKRINRNVLILLYLHTLVAILKLIYEVRLTTYYKKIKIKRRSLVLSLKGYILLLIYVLMVYKYQLFWILVLLKP